MANRNWASAGKIYSMHVKPVLLDCNFVVDAANGNGLGIRNLKGPAVKSVFMHTSAPLAGSGNPNPPAGFIYVLLNDNYNRYYSGFSGSASPISGTPLTAITANSVYTIVSLGTATAAQWLAAGVPAGQTAAVGLSFVAAASVTIGGSASVEAPATAGANITNIEVIGDPNASISNVQSSTNGGAYMLLRCMKNGALQAPADNSVISLAFYLGDSSIMIQGE